MSFAPESEAVYDFLLTPQFYTFQKKRISLRFAYQAMRIAPSVLGELIEEKERYRYFVYKDEAGWNFFAYDPREILDCLKAKGFSESQIGKIYFAQQAVRQLDTPILLNEKEALGTIDETVALASKTFFEHRTFTTIEAIERPKRGIYLKRDDDTGVLFTKKVAMVYSVVLALFSLFWIVEGVRYDKRLEPVEKRIRAVLSEMPELESGYTRESIYRKYKKIDTVQRGMRSWLVRLSKAVFSGVSLQELRYKKNRIYARFVCKDRATASRFVKALEGEKRMKVLRNGNTEVTVEGTL